MLKPAIMYTYKTVGAKQCYVYKNIFWTLYITFSLHTNVKLPHFCFCLFCNAQQLWCTPYRTSILKIEFNTSNRSVKCMWCSQCVCMKPALCAMVAIYTPCLLTNMSAYGTVLTNKQKTVTCRLWTHVNINMPIAFGTYNLRDFLRLTLKLARCGAALL